MEVLVCDTMCSRILIMYHWFVFQSEEFTQMIDWQQLAKQTYVLTYHSLQIGVVCVCGGSDALFL